MPSNLGKAKTAKLCGVNINSKHVFQGRALLRRTSCRIFQEMARLAYERKRASLFDFVQHILARAIEREYAPVKSARFVKRMDFLFPKAQQEMKEQPLDAALRIAAAAAFVQ